MISMGSTEPFLNLKAPTPSPKKSFQFQVPKTNPNWPMHLLILIITLFDESGLLFPKLAIEALRGSERPGPGPRLGRARPSLEAYRPRGVSFLTPLQRKRLKKGVGK